MSLEAVIQKAVEAIVEKKKVMQLTEGVVTSVNKSAKTCNVERDGLPELFDVRLCSIVEPQDNVMVIYPSVGSHVLCVMIENNPTDCYVASTDKIDEIVANNGENGGIPLVNPIASQLQAIKNDLNNLKTVFNSWVVAPQDGGAALKMASATWAGQTLPDVDSTQLQNDKFKH